MIRLLPNPQSQVKTVAERWAKQYPPGSNYGTNKQAITAQLRKLGPRATPRMVKEIIGNDSWCGVKMCDACTNRPAVIEVGQEEDFDSSTANLCISCVKQAAHLIRGLRGGK